MADQGLIADIAFDEDMARIIAKRGEGVGIAGVGELVEVDHPLDALLHLQMHEIAADEAGAAGDEKSAHDERGLLPEPAADDTTSGSESLPDALSVRCGAPR